MDIIENQKNHSNAMSYEFFLNRAFEYDKRLNRPNKSELINLVKAENGNGPTFLTNFEKQLVEVIDRLKKAIEIFIAKSEGFDKKKSLENLSEKINLIKSSNDIPEIIEEGLEITENFIS